MVLNLKTILERDIKMNNKDKIVKKLLFEIIDKLTKDVDVYNHNGSLWLIKTDSRKWVFEFTKSKTLWYNYSFFKSALKFVSLDISEEGNEKYITEWFESRYLNINHVKHTDFPFGLGDENAVEDTIQNGVKETIDLEIIPKLMIDDIVQNGVKEVLNFYEPTKYTLEKVVQKGVKDIRHDHKPLQPLVDDAIQNGVKETKADLGIQSIVLEDTIQNGVKEIKEISDSSLCSEIFKVKCKIAIKDGVKHTEMGDPFKSLEAERTIQNGVKEIKTVDESCFMGYSTEFLYRIILVEDTIQNGVKHTEKSLQIDGSCVIEEVIQNGFKEEIKK